VICGIVICCLLVAGLWPFHAPLNRVDWLSDENGLHFGRQGSILSSGDFRDNDNIGDSARSVEIWLRADSPDSGSGTILAFYTPAKSFVPFSVRQNKDSLELLHEFVDQQHHLMTERLGLMHVFRHARFVLLTITSGARGTTVYADGLPLRASSDFKFSPNDLSGRLVVGNSGVQDDSWFGVVRGLAIYDRGLTSEQVGQHFQEWTRKSHPEITISEAALALYLFNEGSGRVVHNQLDHATVLLIPSRFFLLHHELLVLPWEAFRRRWSYWKDIFINIAGFVPLGFFLYAYFSLAKRAGAAALTIIVGFSISLTIELLQVLLPTRDSGATDIITNTLGTGVGVTLCNYLLRRQELFGWK
jgi:hypothetical protein